LLGDYRFNCSMIDYFWPAYSKAQKFRGFERTAIAIRAETCSACAFSMVMHGISALTSAARILFDRKPHGAVRVTEFAFAYLNSP